MHERQLHGQSEQQLDPSPPGRQIATARAALGLSLEDVNDATCIRAGILRRMEADDFGACGGNFYARGHLRIVGQALHLDVQSLIDEFDHDHAEVDLSGVDTEDEPTGRPHTRRSTLVLQLCLVTVLALTACLLVAM